MEWSSCISIQQWLLMRSVQEGGRAVVGGAARPQSTTVRWAGTKTLDRGRLDWPNQPGWTRAPRPAKTQGTAPVQTRELAALFVCWRTVRPRLEQYVASSPRSHSVTMRIHSMAMKTSLAPSVCPGGRIGGAMAGSCINVFRMQFIRHLHYFVWNPE